LVRGKAGTLCPWERASEPAQSAAWQGETSGSERGNLKITRAMTTRLLAKRTSKKVLLFLRVGIKIEFEIPITSARSILEMLLAEEAQDF